MTDYSSYSFTRYLAAKKSVDDRALNRLVFQALVEAIPQGSPHSPVRVLEVGAGIGTMIERLTDAGALKYAEYSALDADKENMQAAARRLESWAKKKHPVFHRRRADRLQIQTDSGSLAVRLITRDVFEFMLETHPSWNVLIANAFLDLVDIPASLPKLLHMIVPGGLFYFSINFDGLTAFEPEIDPVYDAFVMDLYHRTMDERLVAGKPSGDSRAGRHLFQLLMKNQCELIQAGASDWVVYPGSQGYPADEGYFLHFIIHTMQQALMDHPAIDGERFKSWIARRHAQVEGEQLIYIAHQLDFVGKTPLS